MRFSAASIRPMTTPLLSSAPRPYTQPSCRKPSKGSQTVQPSPPGTTSRWPQNSTGFWSEICAEHQRSSILPSGRVAQSMTSMALGYRSRKKPVIARMWALSPVTLGMRMAMERLSAACRVTWGSGLWVVRGEGLLRPLRPASSARKRAYRHSARIPSTTTALNSRPNRALKLL